MRIQRHVAARGVRPQDGELVRGGFLRGLEIVEYRAGGAGGERQAVASEGFERGDPETAQDGFGRPLQVERLASDGRDRRAVFERGRVGFFGNQQLGGTQARELDRELGRGYLRRGVFAGGDVGVSDAGAVAVQNGGGEVVVGFAVQQRILDHRSGRHHADDFAVDQPFGLGGVGRLLADGDFVALPNEAREIRFERVIGYPRERDFLPRPEFAGGERDFELSGDEARVFVESLVEIAHPEHQNGVLVFAFDAKILSAGGRSHGIFILSRTARGAKAARGLGFGLSCAMLQ